MTNQLTVEGAISLQLVGYVTESDTAEPQIIAKSPVVSGHISPSINGAETEADSNPSLIHRIWAKIQAWADKIHFHNNSKTLDDFYCYANEIRNDDEFPILPDVVGIDRVSFKGNELRYSGDGAVVSRVEEAETDGVKFLRLTLAQSSLATNFNVPEFIDIPVERLVEKEIEKENGSGLIIGNSSGLEIELPTGGAGGDATVTVDGDTLVIPASAFLANALDEIEAMIDESGVLDE